MYIPRIPRKYWNPTLPSWLLTPVTIPQTQVLSGEMRFLRIRAYPEKIGAEAPEQPQNSRQSQKRGIFLCALALAAGAKQTGGNRTAAGHYHSLF